MAWPAEGKRTLTIEVIVGLIVALVGLLFVDVPLWVKLPLASLMAALGLLNFLALIGILQGWSLNRYSRRSRRQFANDPEFVSELRRLDRRIHAVLYERSGDHASLDLQGEQVIEEAMGTGSRKGTEFDARLAVLNKGYEPIHVRIDQFAKVKRRKQRWDEFLRLQREVSGHLDVVHLGFVPVYVAAASTDAISAGTRHDWHRFVVDYNEVLAQWNTFVDRLSVTLRVGWPTTAKPAEDLPSSVR